MSQTSLFEIKNRKDVHKITGTPVFITHSIWYKGDLDLHCLVPTEDEKGKPYFANAIYTTNEIIID